MAAITARDILGYSQISEQVAKQESIIRNVSNLEIQGTPGSTTVSVYVNALSTVATYVPGTGVTATNDTSAYVNLGDFTEVGISEIIDGYTIESAPADLVVSRLYAAISAMDEQIDTDALAVMITDGTELVATGSAAPVDSTVYADILLAKTALDTAKAPQRDRSLLITPALLRLMLDQDSKLVLNTPAGDAIQQDGYFGRVLGFDVYMTTLMTAGTNFIAMQKRGFAFGDSWVKTPAIVSLDGTAEFYGDSCIKARNAYVYGAVRPTFIQVNNGAA